MHLFALGVIGQGMDVRERQIFQLLLTRRTGIAGRDIDLLQTGCLSQTPGQRMLTPARADDKYFHGKAFSATEDTEKIFSCFPLCPL